MSHFDEVLESPEWAFAFAAALEQQLGDDRILSVGSARAGVAEILGEEPTRSVSLGFTTANGYRGSITLTAVATFAQTLQDAASDATISTTCGAAFEAAVRMIAEQAVVGVDAAPEYSIDAEADTNAGDDGDGDGEDGVDVAAFPLLDGRDVLASLALTMSSNAQAATHGNNPTDDSRRRDRSCPGGCRWCLRAVVRVGRCRDGRDGRARSVPHDHAGSALDHTGCGHRPRPRRRRAG